MAETPVAIDSRLLDNQKGPLRAFLKKSGGYLLASYRRHLDGVYGAWVGSVRGVGVVLVSD